ncbi:mechanosensitive ion channel domain-containing protein [Ramlibacter sp. PS3R-8]|uniref:mechanosensitive ion channel family protein n=1 Tax=Ramlibacter sp. PS3R-8 TaxID=3133437 RepID=UPI0030976E93
MNALDLLLRDVGHGALAWEVAVLSGCLAVAWGVCWLLGRRAPPDSIWFGRGTIDGVLFPMLALGLTYSARVGFGSFREVPLLRVAVPVLVALVGIRLLARVFTVAFPRSAFARLMERLFSWVAWIAAVLWILGLLPAVLDEMEAIRFSFGKSEISLLAIVQGVLSSGLVMVLALWVASALERQVLRDTVSDLSLRKAASNAIRATLLLLGFLFALSAVGVDLTALSVLGGALGVGLGFGLQKLAANYVSGFVILAERSLRIGDTVRVDNFEGVVADIKTRYTLIRSLSGRESIVPNEKLITERIENLSLADPKVLLSTEVGVSYDADADQVREILLEAARGAPRVIAEPGPGVQLVKFGSSALEFKLVFWIADPQNGSGAVISDVNFRVLQGLRAAGIEIPYPQQVVHEARQRV